MAFFTDNKEIAENYSRDKSDTSLAYEEEYDSYETQFRVNGKSIVDYWYTLNYAQKKELTEKIKQVTFNDDDEIVLDPNNEYGIGNFNDYELKLNRGNALSVLVDGWLGGGTLWNEESRFLEVLDKIGIKNAEYKDPNFRDEKVYKVYLNVTNPFNTANVDEEFISDLEDYVSSTDMSIYDTENSQADSWDKHGIDIEDWIERLRDDYEQGTTYSWTSIPDVVTDFLKDYGKYDGIVDQGGKRGGNIHTVVIPFYSNQIKNVDNTNSTDSTDIRYSLNVNAEVDVDKALNDKYYNQDIVLTDTTPSIVASQKGVNNYPMLMKASHIRENIFTRDEAKNKGYNTGKNINYHGLGKELFLNIISDLDKVQRAYRGTKNAENPSRRENYFLLISQYTDSDGKTINVPMYINEKGKYNRVFIDTNKLATVFGRDDFESYIKRELSKGNLVRIKNRSNQVSEATLAISADYNKITSKDSISNSNKNVNTKLSKDVNFTQSELESLKDENRELRRKNRYLEKANTNLKEQFKLTGGRVLKPNNLKAVATRIKSEWNTTLTIDEIAKRIQQMYERNYDDKENLAWETFFNECTAIAQDAWDNQKAPELDSYAKEILTDIRSSKISLTEEQKKETAYHNDTYRDYLRNNFGNIKIANDGVPLNVKWMEWSEKYPDLFNPETTDLFQHILHLSQNINNR